MTTENTGESHWEWEGLITEISAEIGGLIEIDMSELESREDAICAVAVTYAQTALDVAARLLGLIGDDASEEAEESYADASDAVMEAIMRALQQ